MNRKKTLPHRRLKKKPKARQKVTLPPAPAESLPAAQPLSARQPAAPARPAVAIDFKDIETYVRRELVRIAVVAAAVFGLIFILGSLVH